MMFHVSSCSLIWGKMFIMWQASPPPSKLCPHQGEGYYFCKELNFELLLLKDYLSATFDTLDNQKIKKYKEDEKMNENIGNNLTRKAYILSKNLCC